KIKRAPRNSGRSRRRRVRSSRASASHVTRSSRGMSSKPGATHCATRAMDVCSDSSKRKTARSRTGMAEKRHRPRTSNMRLTALVFGVLLSIVNAAGAQEWDEYTSLQDGFRINFPGTPQVTESTWTSQLNYVLPDRIYSADRGKERYSVTVVDYSSIEQQGIERAKSCPPGNANCRANAPATLGPGYSHHD